MKYNIDIKGLGIRITPQTSQADLDRICAAHPEVKKLIDKLNQDGKEKTTAPGK